MSRILILLICMLGYMMPSFAALEQQVERGPVKVKLSVTPEKPKIGDRLILTLTVTAEPQIELIMPEFGQALSRFAIVDFVPRQTINDQGKTVASQRYTLSIPRSGKQSIPQLTIEFVDRRPGQRLAPEDEDAYEILTNVLAFEVKSITPKDADDKLKPLLGKLPLHPKTTVSKQKDYQPLWIALAVSLLLIAALAVWFWKRHHQQHETAYEAAYRQLIQLKAKPAPNNHDTIEAFFIELSAIVRHYLENRFNLHAPELTTEEFLDVAARSPDLTDDHRHFLRGFLAHADQVKFAGLVPSADDINHALTAVENFLQQTKPEEGTDV